MEDELVSQALILQALVLVPKCVEIGVHVLVQASVRSVRSPKPWDGIRDVPAVAARGSRGYRPVSYSNRRDQEAPAQHEDRHLRPKDESRRCAVVHEDASEPPSDDRV